MAHFRTMSTAKLTLFVAASLLLSVTAIDPNIREVVFSIKSKNVSFAAAFYKQFHECLCTGFQCLAYVTPENWVYNITQTRNFSQDVGSSNIFFDCTVILGQHQRHLSCTRNQYQSDVNEKNTQTYRLESSTCRFTCISFILTTGGDGITFSNKNLSPKICDLIPMNTRSTSTKSYQSRDENNGPPVDVILGVVLGVIVIAVIVIIGVVIWKRRKAASKSSDHTSRKPTQTTSSENSHEENSKKKRGGEPYYVNTIPSTHVSKPHVSGNGHRNSSSLKEQNINTSAANSIVQGNTGSNDNDFGYYTAHTVSSQKDDNDTNDTISAKDNTGNQFYRTSDDYGYAHAEDPSNKDNMNITNKNGPSIVATVHSSVKNVNDDYDYAFCDDDEVPEKKANTNRKDLKEAVSPPSKMPPSANEVEDEYAVVNKNGSMAKGDSKNSGISSTDNDGAWAGISSEATDVYSKLHENERHITNPYDSLLHLNSSSDAVNQPEPAHKLHTANQSSPYDLAQPIPRTSANENGSSATVEFELVPVSSSAGKSDEKNQAQQGKKQAKKLPYGPEDYAVVVKNKPTNESKVVGFELEN